MDTPRRKQPAVDDLPLVAAFGLKIQELGPRVLQLQKELQRIPAGCPGGIDCLGLHPLVPLLDDQAPCLFLFHSIQPNPENLRSAGTAPLEAKDYEIVFPNPERRPQLTAERADAESAQERETHAR